MTNMYYAFASDPKVVATLNGSTVRPAAADALSTVYACTDSSSTSPASWQLQIDAPDPDRVDVITVTLAKH